MNNIIKPDWMSYERFSLALLLLMEISKLDDLNDEQIAVHLNKRLLHALDGMDWTARKVRGFVNAFLYVQACETSYSQKQGK